MIIKFIEINNDQYEKDFKKKTKNYILKHLRKTRNSIDNKYFTQKK